ncbi:MAG: hypothetical protein ACYSWQ_17580 [Planctomycetota bacterium]|jgi:hypothetical protein
MRTKTLAVTVLTIAALALTYFVVETRAQGRGDGPVIYVTSQGLYYDSIVKAPLPPNGPFQLLVPTSGGLETEFGPGNVGYLGGRWWVDANGNGMQDDGDAYFMCPLLPPGRLVP